MNMVQLFVTNMLVVLYVSQGGSRWTQEDMKFEAVICEPTLDEQYGEDPIYTTEKQERSTAQNRMLICETRRDHPIPHAEKKGNYKNAYNVNKLSHRDHKHDQDRDYLARNRKEVGASTQEGRALMK
ncbi:hypothetical protein AK812_SmicGene38433 [Symbiodinium microadriaticum]|uniref:Secreted protein n=1 Tax=Symbiodinium microadriaticum TaxID=2951 RepID=A0A1Q9CDR9_SYMMI|nr:hypothetical protein AK812_SmicGene38433 [Symbiodinium microadriaticum]